MQTQPIEISLEKAYEIRHWMSVLHLDECELYQAVRHVGKELDALKRHCDSVKSPVRVRL